MEERKAVFLAPLLLASTLYAPVPESGSFRGAVAVEAAGADVAVYVDTNRDGSIDHRFRLQREPEDVGDAVTPPVFPSAHVAFEPGLYYACCMQGSPPKCGCIRGG